MMNIWRTIAAVAIFVLFVLSIVPAALADDESSGRTGTRIDVDTKIDTEVSVKSGNKEIDNETETKTRTRARVESNGEVRVKEETRKKIREGAEDKREKLEAMEMRLKTRIKAAHDKMQRVRDQYKEAQDRFKMHKETLLELHTIVKGCKKDSEKQENCQNEKKMLREGVKEHLLKTAEVILHSIEKLRIKIETAENLEESDVTAALETLAALEVDVKAEQEKIKALTENSSAEEIKTEIKALKERWKEVRKEQQRLIVLSTNAKVESLLEKHHGLVRSMEARIAAATRASVGTSDLKAIKTRLEAHITVLEEKYESAKEEWQQSDHSEAARKEWQLALQEIRKGMKQSQEILREFMREFRSLRVKAEISNETTGEVATEEE